MMTFAAWLVMTKQLQTALHGADPGAFQGPDRASYIRYNTLAAVAELMEFLNETRWKPWQSDPGEVIRSDAALEELVDVLHFIANLLVSLQVSPDDLSEAYLAKHRMNYKRLLSGQTVEVRDAGR